MSAVDIEVPKAPEAATAPLVADVAQDAPKSTPEATTAVKKRHQVAKACQHCAASHLSCNEHRPCERCVKKGLDCEERPRKRRNVRSQDISRFEPRGGDDDEHIPLDEVFVPRREPRPSRSRKSKRKVMEDMDFSDIDEESEQEHEHGPDCDHSHSHSHSHSHDKLRINTKRARKDSTPTSLSPRSNGHDGHSHSDDKESVSDLESLVVAALAEDKPVEAKPVMQPFMMPNPMMQMPFMMPNPMMPYGFQMPYMMEQQQQMMHMLQMGLMPLQWRFHGQPMSPVQVPISATARDLITVIANRLVYERLMQPSERLALAINVNQHRYALDERANGGVPVTMLGLNEPSAFIDAAVIKIHTK